MRAIILIVPLIVLVAFYPKSPLRRTVRCGPLIKNHVEVHLRRQLVWKHGLAAYLALHYGYYAFGSTYIRIDPWLPFVLLGWLAATPWVHWRMKRLRVQSAGPGPDVPKEKWFPSDHLAAALHEGHVEPLPIWGDLAVLVLCVVVGMLVGMGAQALLPGIRQ